MVVFEENACLGIFYCFVSTLTVKTTYTTSAVKLLCSASQHLWMTSSLASQKQSAEFLTKLSYLLSTVSVLRK